MREAGTIADLLNPEPPQWGLRGDPHLWGELRQALASTPLPATEAELVALLEETYLQLVGTPLSATEPTFVARHSHGGDVQRLRLAGVLARARHPAATDALPHVRCGTCLTKQERSACA